MKVCSGNYNRSERKILRLGKREQEDLPANRLWLSLGGLRDLAHRISFEKQYITTFFSVGQRSI